MSTRFPCTLLGRAWPALLLVAAALGCAERPPFSLPNAERHVRTLAGDIGVRVAGSDGARRARAYLVSELTRYGFDVRIQEALASRPEHGLSARVANVIAVREGQRREAVALVSHYDSPPESRGAADDGLGLAVLVEAGRVLAMRADPRWSLVIAATDAEEYGLLGAAALVTDPVWSRVSAYLNFEAVGSGPPVMLFEAGPDNAWLTRAWARFAPRPAGTSLATEVYKRLPNDTDFTILARTGVPGLNFATVGDSYSYHTSRDVPGRLSRRALEQAGQNAIAIVEGLETIDITARTPGHADYVAVRGVGAVVLPAAAWLAALAALVAIPAWILAGRRLLRESGLLAVVVTVIWIIAGTALALAAMVAAVAALRFATGLLHPWYAHPWRTLVCLAATAGAVGWLVARLRELLPAALRGAKGLLVPWVVSLPVWLALTVMAWRMAPSATYLAAIPTVAAALAALVAVALRGSGAAVRIAGLLALVATAAVWFDPVTTLFPLVVPILGRLQIETPVFVLPALVAIAGFWLAPPAVASAAGLGGSARAARRWIAAGLLVFAVASWTWAWRAPAYTDARAQYQVVRAIHDLGSSRAVVEVGGSEPMPPPALEGDANAPAGWQLVSDESATDVALGRLRSAFVYRATMTPAPAPASVTARTETTAAVVLIAVEVVPTTPLYSISVVLPPGVAPTRASHPGIVARGRWRAVLVAPTMTATNFTLAFAGGSAPSPESIRVVVTAAGLPGGAGWQRLPAWLPAEPSAWTARSVFVLAPDGRQDAR